jgi:hypothetical protein
MKTHGEKIKGLFRSALTSSIAVAALFGTQQTRAEVLHGILPLSTLGDIKQNFPNGKFVRVNAAWVKADEAFYSMAGEGFPGTLYVAFDDSRPTWRTYISKMPPSTVEAPDPSDGVFTRSQVVGFANAPDEQALTVAWVRWVPTSPIPMERVKAKYGEPSSCGFESDDFQPFCVWEKRSLKVATSDDKKFARMLTAAFSREEKRSAYKEKYGSVPQWLMDEPSGSAPKDKPKLSPKR